MEAHYHFRKQLYFSLSGFILIISFGTLLVGAPLLYPDKLSINEVDTNMIFSWGIIFTTMYWYILLQKVHINHRNFCLSRLIDIYLLCKEAKLKEVSFSQGSHFQEMIRDYGLVSAFYEYDRLLKADKISYKDFKEKIEIDTNHCKQDISTIKKNLFYGFIIFLMFSLAFKYYSTKF